MTQQTRLEEDRLADFNLITHMSDGMSFGELALISYKPRAATIVCEAPTHFAVLKGSDFKHAFGKIQQKRLNEEIAFLKQIPMFSDWTKVALQKMTYFFVKKEFKFGHIAFREGEPLNYIYFVQSG